MTPDPRAVALLAASFALFAWVLYRFRRFAAVFATVMLLLFPILSDTSDWNNWFDWVKRYTVLVSAFMWAVLQAYPRHRVSQWFVRIWPFLLILNVVEPALLEFPKVSPLNGILLLIVAACGPLQFPWSDRYQRFGFRGVFWQAAFLGTLARLYALNPEFENSVVGLLVVIVLASLFTLWQRDTFNYMSWRAYTLYALLLQDSLWPKSSDWFYPEWLHAENRTTWHGTPFANVWLALNVVLAGLMIYERLRALRGNRLQPAPGLSRSVAGVH
jgi:hypothetical protein